MSDNVAIRVENVTKAFKIPHEKHTSLKSTVLNIFSKKGFTVFEAAKNIDFEVNKGEFIGIIGRNGSGKSTLLKMLAGIYVPDKGKIKINGRLSPFLELGVGFNPELTARDNVFLGGSILGLSRKEIEGKFDEIIKFAELEEFVDMKFKNFSSGMQVRLAFALSINAHAEILLMDEVLAVGDSNFQAKCLEEFNNYKEQGKTVVLVTHDVSTVEKYCDRAMLLRGGKIEKIGNTSEVVNLYTSQNMADQEGDHERGDVELSSDRVGKPQKGVEIKGVKILSGAGEQKNSFVSGEPLKFEISYKVNNKNIKELNFAVGLRTGEGVLVFGYVTESSKFIPKKKSGKITLSIGKLNLMAGKYYINITSYGREYSRKYDFCPKIGAIDVYNSGERLGLNGLVYLDHEWTQK